MRKTWLRSAGGGWLMADKDDEQSVSLDPEVRSGVYRSGQLVVEIERLTHSLRVHLDQIDEMVQERRGS